MISLKDYSKTHILYVDCQYTQSKYAGKGTLDLLMMLLDKQDRNIKSGIKKWNLKDNLYKCCLKDEEKVFMKIYNNIPPERLIEIYNNDENLLEIYKALGE